MDLHRRAQAGSVVSAEDYNRLVDRLERAERVDVGPGLVKLQRGKRTVISSSKEANRDVTLVRVELP